MKFSNIKFNNHENKIFSLAYGCRNDGALLDKFDLNGVSILSFKKHVFADVIELYVLKCCNNCLKNVYKKHSMHKQGFFQSLQYLLVTISIDIVAGNFKYDPLKVSQNTVKCHKIKSLDIFTDHVQIVNKLTLIFRSLIDHVYINKALMEEYC